MSSSTNIEVVESRSDDETCSCSCSAAPSEVEEEIRDGSGDEMDCLRDDDNLTSNKYDDAGGVPMKAIINKGVPDSIPEEPTPSSEETEFSAGTQGTDTTLETEGTEGSMQRNETEKERESVMKASTDVQRTDEDDKLLNVPSDEAVFAGTDQRNEEGKIISAPSDEDVPTNPPKPEPDQIDQKKVQSGQEDNTVDTKPKPDQIEQKKKVQSEQEDADLARQQWDNAVASLKANPSLMTANILKLALHNRPPLAIIKFMIGLNPEAAGVPRSGPSALQIAVRHHASIEVVEEVIRACPYALFTGNGTYDPLTYAKIWRREDEDLIKMLERPISYWISGEATSSSSASSSNRSSGQQKREVRFKNTGEDQAKVAGKSSCVPDSPASPDHSSLHSPPPTPALKSPSRLTKEEKRELSNIKLITAAIVKAQKKQIAEAEKDKRDMNAKLKTLAKSEARARRDMVQFVDERIKKSAKAHLVAIDMKERAFESRIATIGKDISDMLTESTERQERIDREREERDEEVRKTVEGAVSTMKDEILAAADRVEKATASYGAKLAELAVRVDKESVANAAFRNDVRQRQGDLEERIETTLAGGCFVPAEQSMPDPSFEIESIPATNSTDHLFDETFDGIDETYIMGSKSSGEFEYPPSQIQDSFSSEWNSRRGLVQDEQPCHSDASWWKAIKFEDKKKKSSKGRWKRWLKLG